jgi:dTDP-L-rhamnose 4-epimerase
MPTKVLITGGAGFIGSHTADALSKLGYRIRIMDNLSKPVHNGRCPSYLSKKYEFINGDVTKKEDWQKALKGIDIVYHLAAYQDYLPDFSKFFQVNTVSTAILYELIEEKKFPVKRVIYASSQSVYGEGKYKYGKKEIFLPMKEQDSLEAHNSYGMSKIAAESVAFNLGKRLNIPTVALRYSIVQGSRQSPYNAYSGALRIFVSQAVQNEDITVYEDGNQQRDFINIKDVVNANIIVLKDKRADFQAFNVGGGKPYKIIDFAKTVLRVLDFSKSKIKITGEFRVGDTRNAVSDISKLKKLGWKPKYTPEDSIKEYYSWFKNLPIDRKYQSENARRNMKKLGVLK